MNSSPLFLQGQTEKSSNLFSWHCKGIDLAENRIQISWFVALCWRDHITIRKQPPKKPIKFISGSSIYNADPTFAMGNVLQYIYLLQIISFKAFVCLYLMIYSVFVAWCESSSKKKKKQIYRSATSGFLLF